MSDAVSVVKNALSTMYSNANQQEKQGAMAYLEEFQKSPASWEAVHSILGSESESTELKLFAAQTLRSKIIYDLHQLPEEGLIGLKDSLINMLISYNDSLKVIRTQLCIALSNLTLQFMQWPDAIPEIISRLYTPENPKLITSLLEFLKILPEELSDSKKTPLTDAEFQIRTQQLIMSNVEQVLSILNDLAAGSANTKLNSLILDCLNSWIKECPIQNVLSIDSLTTLIFKSLLEPDAFDTSIECLCTILRETRDIENFQLIDALYQQLVQLRPWMEQNKEDPDIMSGLTRLFVEAGESWHVLIANHPKHFRPLVEILLECTNNEEDLDTAKYAFYFWYILKQIITIDKFKESKQEFSDIYTKLIEVIIKHLRYPSGENDSNLFDDKEQEDKFKDFRYDMGDVLKDCCAVIGPTKALSIPLHKIQTILAQSQGQQVTWQEIEAPLFSMRAMAKEVSLKENVILPQIMNLLIQLPEHSKIRYAATLVLGRYTEWTAKHPEFLEPQLNYITGGFNNANKDVIIAASHALKFFCQDCSKLLVNYIEPLYTFYSNVASSLELQSLYEVTDGIAHIVKQQDVAQLYQISSMFFKPTVDKLTEYANMAGTPELYTEIADQIEVLSIFVDVIRPKNYTSQSYPVADLVIEIWPIVSQLITKHGSSSRVSERCLKFLKNSIQSYNTYLNPILASVATVLHDGFQANKFGCYLWVTGIIIREFADEYSSEEIKESVYQFSIQQAISFFQLLNTTAPTAIPDVIEDFFRMMLDVLMFYPFKFISGELLKPSFDAALAALTLEQFDPLIATLHYLIDLFSWGFEYPPISYYETNPAEIQLAIKTFTLNNGGHLIKTLIHGLIFRFPTDVQQDGSDLLVKILTLNASTNANDSVMWLSEAIDSLPNVNDKEKNNLLTTISNALSSKDNRRIRSSLKDFVNWYARKNVTPRSQFGGQSESFNY